VAFDGTNFLVVWEEYSFDWCGTGSCEWDIHGWFIDPSTLALSGGLVNVAVGVGNQREAAIAFGGGRYLVAFKGTGISSPLSAATVEPDGTASAPFVVRHPTGPIRSPPAVASDGTGFMLAWGEEQGYDACDVLAQYVSGGGPAGELTVVDASPEVQGDPAVGWDGANYLVAYIFQRTNGWDLLGKFVPLPPLDGVATAEPIVISNAPGWRSRPAVLWRGDEYLVAWQDERWGYGATIYGQRVDTDGALIGEDASHNWALVASSDEVEHMQAFGVPATDGTRALLVWDRFVGSPPQATLHGQVQSVP
jgi:hypothetical protein